MGIYSRSMNENDKSVSDYRNYITEHRENVLKAFTQFQFILQNSLDFDMSELRENISKHDLSKFSSEEFETYRQFFHPREDETPDKNIMNYGWLHHIHNNPHHWNYWIVVDDTNTVLDMPDIYIAEMLLDWAAMSIKFNSSTNDWYHKNYDKITVSKNTRDKIDRVIDQL